MTKTRINTTLRGKLESWVRQRINDNIDQTPLEEAKGRLEAELLRLAQAEFPPHETAILHKHGKTDRFSRFRVITPDGQEGSVELGEVLPYELPAGTYRFEDPMPVDGDFVHAADEVTRIKDALNAEASRQWEQAKVLINCALYFEDVLECLRVPHAERVDLSARWHLPGYGPKAEPVAGTPPWVEEAADEAVETFEDAA